MNPVIKQLNDQESALRAKKDSIIKEIEAIQKKKRALSVAPQFTDHALLRYIERVRGFNIEGLRKELLGRSLGAITSGATSITLDGVKYLIKNNAVVTVVNS